MTIDPVFARNPKEAERLARKHMLIVGLGSVGSALALMAARSGVGHFTLVDPDTLALENVGRHMLSRDCVGQSKVRAMKRAIKAINPAAEVHAIAKDFTALSPNSLSNGSRPDILVADTDSFRCQSFVNSVSLDERVPAVYVGCWGEASVGEVFYVIPDATPCFECYAGFRRNTAALPVDDPRRYTDPNFDGTKLPGQAGLWANILMVSAVAFQVILAILDPECDRSSNLIDRDRTLFLVNVSAYTSPLQPLAVTFGRVSRGCPVCDDSKLEDLGKDLGELVPTELPASEEVMKE